MLLAVLLAPILRHKLEKKFHQGARNQALVVETLSGIGTIKSLSAEPKLWHRWEQQLARYVSTSFDADLIVNLSSHVSQFVNKLVMIALLWLGARQVLEGQLTIGGLVAFNMLAMRVSQPMLRLMNVWQEFQQAGISMDRLGDIFNSPTEVMPSQAKSRPSALSGHVEFRQVSFRYRPDTMDVLSRLDLEIQPGEVIGLVGASGSGKSTLARLLQNLHKPYEGQVLIDNLDVKQLEVAWLRQQVGVLSQEHFLFNGTIRENIAFADPSAPMESVVEAAKLAAAHEFILNLPGGYDEPVGEQGATLSGGQRQRLALARLLLANPRILVLDEATSALDYLSESLILNNLAQICRGRTVIIIAHRLNMVRNCDRILVLEQGRVIEQGSHDKLIEREGRYAELHAAQSEWAGAAQLSEARVQSA
jgi:subfamily B ATP-binding cassette protein HlyB/CyaB